MTTITINDLDHSSEHSKQAMAGISGGWFDYNPYYSTAYYSGYYGLGGYSGYGYGGYGFGSMGSWLNRQGSIDAGHDAFIDSIWA